MPCLRAWGFLHILRAGPPCLPWSAPSILCRTRADLVSAQCLLLGVATQDQRDSGTPNPTPLCCPCPAKCVSMAMSLTASRCYGPWLGHRDAQPRQVWVRALLCSGLYPQRLDRGPPLMRSLQHEGQVEVGGDRCADSPPPVLSGCRGEARSPSPHHPVSGWATGAQGRVAEEETEGPGMTLGASGCCLRV